MFPAGILQGVYFDDNRPKYLNYGSIGFIMGHEMTHGFDDRGRQFDKSGNLVNWWDEETAKQYLIRAQCIIDQYANYTVREIREHVSFQNLHSSLVKTSFFLILCHFILDTFSAKVKILFWFETKIFNMVLVKKSQIAL